MPVQRWMLINGLALLLAAFATPSMAYEPSVPAPKPSPTTANEVSGPVYGALPDRLELSLNPFQGSSTNVRGRETLRVPFCTLSTSYNIVTINGRRQREARTDCNTPSRKLNQTGKTVQSGISMTPDIEGVWRWQDDYTLGFTPRHPWPIGQSYKVVFSKDAFPPMVRLSNAEMSFTAAPLTVQIAEMNFFQDPNDLSKKGVSAKLQFSAPVTVDDLREHLNTVMEELTLATQPTEQKLASTDVKLPIEVTLDESGMNAAVTIALQVLPDQERFVRLDITPGIVSTSGGQPLVASANSRMTQRVQIPSRFTYAKITGMEARIIKNDKYEPEQIIIITSNVPVTASELEKHLQFKLLPKDKPPVTEGGTPQRDYAWISSFEIDEKLLIAQPEVKFTVNPTADEYSTTHSVKLESAPDRWVHARISKQMAGKEEFVYANDYNQTLKIPAFPREVQVLSDGALLSLSGAKKISIYALGVKQLRYEIKRVTTANIAHFISQTGGNFANPSFNNYSFDEDNVSEAFSQNVTLPNDDQRRPNFTAFDFTPYLTAQSEKKLTDKPNGKGLFLLTVNAYRMNEKGQPETAASDRRFVLISDLGLVVKTARDGAQDVFVQSVQTGQPVSGATVDVLGVNGLTILQTKTDGDGHAALPRLSGFTNEKRPVAYLVRQGEDLAFLPYGRNDRNLDYSRYETDGVHDSEEGLKAFLFSDRGIYRPGETVHIAMIVKQRDWAQDLSGLPLQVEVTNPRGQVIEKNIIKLTNAGMLDYSFTTRDVSPTGVYNVRLHIGTDTKDRHQLGNTSVRVEEFLPDTMKITSEFSKPMPKGWLTPDGLKAMVTLSHLYGAPAVNHRVKASVSLSPGSFSFKDYADYQFFDAFQATKSFDQPVSETQTDESGKAIFDLKLAQFGNSTYRLTFYGEGFAADSGRSVRTAKSVLVSPLPYVIGFKSEDNLAYINKGSRVNVHMIALRPDLEPTIASDLTSKLYQITYISALIKNERGAYVYRSVPREKELDKSSIAIPVTGLVMPLPTDKPGSFVRVISDAKGTVLQRITYTVVGEGTMLTQARKDAVLTVKLDKPSYKANDMINLNVVAPYAGAGLITLETDKVLSFKWFKSNDNSTTETIQVPAGFTGKGFINVQFLRAIDSKEVYTKPLAYAVQPFFVSTASVDSAIQLNVPDKIKPGETMAIKVQTNEPGKIIVYAVDEGILQYGRYITPKPLDYFVGQRALQVDTAQILDLLMPEYSLLSANAASGGDGGLSDGKNLNPFKRKTLPPVAYWSGVVDVDKAGQTLNYPVPDYFNGSLRVMAVAVSGKTMGAAETRANVKGDIIISPNVPTFAAPDDVFTVGVAVANNIVGSGKDAELSLKVTASEHLDILEGRDAILKIAEGSEGKTQIKVKAKAVLGDARLIFTAQAGEKTARAETSLSVRPPLPAMTALVAGYVPSGEKIVPQDRDLYPEFATADAALSSLPVALIPGLAGYLDQYPYGCTEQIISRVMPAAVLYGNKELGGDSKKAEQSVLTALQRLRELQQSDGSFGYWAHDSRGNDFVSAYALHFLLLARDKHLPVPDDLLRRAQDFAKQRVARVPASLAEARISAYLIYLLTRDGVVTANYLPPLLQYLDANHRTEWKQDLTGVYLASAYRLMQLTAEANAQLDAFELGDAVYWNNNPRYWADDTAFYNSLNRYAQYLSLVAAHFPERLLKLERNILFRVANFVGEGNFNTLSAAYAVMAFSDYAAAAAAQTAGQLAISRQTGEGAFTPLTLSGEQVKRATMTAAPGKVKFTGTGDFGLFYQLATSGYDRLKPTRAVEDGLEISRAYLDSANKPVKNVALGATVDVVVKLRAHGEKDRANIAVVDLLPAGFELVPESVRQEKPATTTASEGDEGGEDGEAAATERSNNRSVEDGDAWQPQMIDAREDRVIAFGEVPTSPVLFRYKIKAVNAGEFTTPPAYAESMYDRMLKARGLPGSIVVQ